MKYAVILFFFFTLNLSAATVLLEKHATSGYVLPEDSFVKDCQIFREGSVESYTKKGDGTIIGFSKMVPRYEIWEIRQLLRLARRAPIADGGVICDAGNLAVTGHFARKPVLIVERKDCMSYKFRQGWASRRLQRIASQLCAF